MTLGHFEATLGHFEAFIFSVTIDLYCNSIYRDTVLRE